MLRLMKKVLIFITSIITTIALSSIASATDSRDPSIINTVNNLLEKGEGQIQVESMGHASDIWRIVDAYIDAISTTSETQTSTALVTDFVMDMTLSNEYNAEFTPAEINAMREEAGSTAASISAFVIDQFDYDVDLLATPEKMTSSHTSSTAKGGMITGKAICQGYANLFTILADNAGIENIKVRGFSGGSYHVMNAVRINGKLYAVDATFFDSSADNVWVMLDWQSYCSLARFTPVIDIELAFCMKYGN